MRIHPLFISLTLLVWASQARAGIRPSFSEEDCAWHATDIVVASEGEVIDGKLQVQETLKGDIPVGTTITVPELANFATQEQRTISTSAWGNDHKQPASFVTGTRMWLFLKKAPTTPSRWLPANFYRDINSSVVWVEKDKTYSFVQAMNPGPSLLMPLSETETELRAKVSDTLRTQESLAEAIALPDLSKRAVALDSFLDSKHYFARQEAFDELPKCKEAALPVLRARLSDQNVTYQQGQVIETLGQAGGIAVGPELTQILKEQIAFWKRTGPTLKLGWWNDMTPPYA